tara:strand:+ start:94 stop:330 length:237 start_codon:yes stop_codon:yes gene_type:complete
MIHVAKNISSISHTNTKAVIEIDLDIDVIYTDEGIGQGIERQMKRKGGRAEESAYFELLEKEEERSMLAGCSTSAPKL